MPEFAPPALSVIVPFFNEEESISAVYDAIVNVLDPLAIAFELIFIDDGSVDRTAGIAKQLASRDSRIRLIRFRRNFGQTPALAAGIDHASGEILITMDGDLQNDPHDIPALLEKLAEGYDVVVGWRVHRRDNRVTRTVPSRIANWLIGKVTGVVIRDTGCTLKVFRASLMRRVPLYADLHRFIPAMAVDAGARIAEIGVRHHPRRFGRSKYGLSRVYRVLLDLLVVKTLVAFRSRPMIWFTALSVPPLALAVVGLVYSFARMFVSDDPVPLPIAGSALVFLMAAGTLIFSGALAELNHACWAHRGRDGRPAGFVPGTD
jgi:glycosyltransferase involved in cell wall biosynthesis